MVRSSLQCIIAVKAENSTGALGRPCRTENTYSAFFSSTLPPFFTQSLADMATQPLPLQALWPLQALSAVAQSLLPLQPLTPRQWTMPSCLAARVGVARVAANRPAAA